MDWFVDARDGAALRALRHEFRAYLERHADPGSDLDGAEVAFSELISNTFRHAPGPAWVHLDWSDRRPSVEVHDLGPGFELNAAPPEDPRAEGGRGLHLVSHLTDELTVAAKRAGGSKVRAVLAVTRPAELSHGPGPRPAPSFPTSHEAAPDGTFGRDPFLLALIVEMERAVEFDQGPAAAEALVAQVGANVGARAEEEYRRARAIVGDLTPEQIADVYVRLKAAIGGGFYVIEATPRRIVLANASCPFGDAVTRAPGLCRITSSVFGGIAARNAGGASVVLEERIAVGDPECRIVVWLGGASREESRSAGPPPA